MAFAAYLQEPSVFDSSGEPPSEERYLDLGKLGLELRSRPGRNVTISRSTCEALL